MRSPWINTDQFTCPNCQTLSSMQWLWIIDGISERITPNFRNYEISRGSSISFLADHFPKVSPLKIAMARCNCCEEVTIWVNGKMVYPDTAGVKPNEDMPEPAKQIFIEAQDVLSKSPRAACILSRLCLEELLNAVNPEVTKKRLCDKINIVAPEGSVLKTLLDACRLSGNEFVHDGTFESLKNSDLTPEQVAQALSAFINLATEQLVSIPKKAEQFRDMFSPK